MPDNEGQENNALGFTIGGQPILLDQDLVVRRWVDTYFPLRHLHTLYSEYESRNGNRSGNYLDVALAQDSWSMMPNIDLNELYWPTGASRFAYGMFLMRLSDVEDWDIGPFESTVKVRFKTGKSTFEAEMYAGWQTIAWGELPSSNSNSYNSSEALALVYVVDDRYFWRGTNIGDISFGDPQEWSDLFSSLGTALIGETIDTSDIDSAFLKPDKQELERKYDSAAIMLDACAHSVGQRVIRKTDGTVFCEDISDAIDRSNDELRFDSEWGEHDGHSVFFDDRPRVALPEKVDVIFQGLINHIPCPHPYKVEKAISEDGDLGISGYKFIDGKHHTIYSTCYADYTTNGTSGEPDNKTVLESLAQKVADSYYQQFVTIGDQVSHGVLSADKALFCFTDSVIYRIGCEVENGYGGADRVCTTRLRFMPISGHPIYQLSQDGDLKVLTANDYLVRLNEGIDPRDGATPGFGESTVYKLDSSGDLEATYVSDFIVYNASEAYLEEGAYLTAHIDEWCTAWLGQASEGGRVCFTLTENMGATTANQAAATEYEHDFSTSRGSITVYDNSGIFSAGLSGSNGYGHRSGGLIYVDQLGCS